MIKSTKNTHWKIWIAVVSVITASGIWLLKTEDLSAADTNKHIKYNRLINESSPYLRQHATNPVDWYPLGPRGL